MKKAISGQVLKKLRIQAGLTTTTVANELGVKSRKTIENWERDFCEPRINQFLRYCQICNTQPYEVVDQVLNAPETGDTE